MVDFKKHICPILTGSSNTAFQKYRDIIWQNTGGSNKFQKIRNVIRGACFVPNPEYTFHCRCASSNAGVRLQLCDLGTWEVWTSHDIGDEVAVVFDNSPFSSFCPYPPYPSFHFQLYISEGYVRLSIEDMGTGEILWGPRTFSRWATVNANMDWRNRRVKVALQRYSGQPKLQIVRGWQLRSKFGGDIYFVDNGEIRRDIMAGFFPDDWGQHYGFPVCVMSPETDYTHACDGNTNTFWQPYPLYERNAFLRFYTRDGINELGIYFSDNKYYVPSKIKLQVEDGVVLYPWGYYSVMEVYEKGEWSNLKTGWNVFDVNYHYWGIWTLIILEPGRYGSRVSAIGIR